MLNPIMHKALETLWKDFGQCLESEFAEDFLGILLRLMQAAFLLSPEYRKNIKGFNGKYQFLSKDGRITISAVFRDGQLRVEEKTIPDPNITVVFRNGRALLNFLLSPNQDILGAMLRHDIETNGNLNYIYKLGYMAKHLQLMVPQL